MKKISFINGSVKIKGTNKGTDCLTICTNNERNNLIIEKVDNCNKKL